MYVGKRFWVERLSKQINAPSQTQSLEAYYHNNNTTTALVYVYQYLYKCHAIPHRCSAPNNKLPKGHPFDKIPFLFTKSTFSSKMKCNHRLKSLSFLGLIRLPLIDLIFAVGNCPQRNPKSQTRRNYPHHNLKKKKKGCEDWLIKQNSASLWRKSEQRESCQWQRLKALTLIKVRLAFPV